MNKIGVRRLLFVFVVAAGTVSSCIYRRTSQTMTRFDRHEWAKADYIHAERMGFPRANMVDSLLSEYRLVGLHESELREILGTPDNVAVLDDGETIVDYQLGGPYRHMRAAVLQLKCGTNGKVVEISIFEVGYIRP